MQPARVHLGEDHEHRRDQGGEHRVVDTPHGNARAGEQEEQRSEQERLVHRARDQRRRDSADHCTRDPLQRAAHGGHRMRLEDDDHGDGHPVAPFQVERGRQQRGRRGDDGDAQRMLELERPTRERVPQRRPLVGRRPRPGRRRTLSAVLQRPHGLERLPGLGYHPCKERGQLTGSGHLGERE